MTQVSTDEVDMHLATVVTRGSRRSPSAARMLESADAAAARGDYVEALAWLRSLDATGRQLDPVYANRRAEWRSKVETHRVRPSQWFG
jgi:hypothetical protein